MFEIKFDKQSEKFLLKSNEILYERLTKKIKSLELDPFPKDTKRVQGTSNKVFRIRVGMYRIEYIVFFENNNILITQIDKRGRIYER
jgi:mRNA interferase RelE/StbE